MRLPDYVRMPISLHGICFFKCNNLKRCSSSSSRDDPDLCDGDDALRQRFRRFTVGAAVVSAPSSTASGAHQPAHSLRFARRARIAVRTSSELCQLRVQRKFVFLFMNDNQS